MPLALKEKELAAVGISVAAGCKPCTDYHVKAVRAAGAADGEIRQAIADAICVRESALKVMKAHGLQLLGESGGDTGCGCAESNRTKELVSIGAAYAVNCTSNLQQHLAAAKNLGIDDEELSEVLSLAGFIKEKAASHVEKIGPLGDNAADIRNPSRQTASAGCGCG